MESFNLSPEGIPLGSNRPLVAIKQSASRVLKIGGNVFPLPFCTLTTCLSEIVCPENLRSLPREEARRLLEKTIIGLKG